MFPIRLWAEPNITTDGGGGQGVGTVILPLPFSTDTRSHPIPKWSLPGFGLSQTSQQKVVLTAVVQEVQWQSATPGDRTVGSCPEQCSLHQRCCEAPLELDQLSQPFSSLGFRRWSASTLLWGQGLFSWTLAGSSHNQSSRAENQKEDSSVTSFFLSSFFFIYKGLLNI